MHIDGEHGPLVEVGVPETTVMPAGGLAEVEAVYEQVESASRIAHSGDGSRRIGPVLTVLSPAKTLDYETRVPTNKHSQPRLLDEAEHLIDEMVRRSPDDVATLMHLSPELAKLNVERYSSWERDHRAGRARQAILAFRGDVYLGMQPERFDARDFTEAQKALRILSGLYGLLRPLDLIHPHRLEMGTALRTDRGRNLYEFWATTITDLLEADLAERSPRVVVNLASQEYFGAIDTGRLDARVVAPRFLDEKGGEAKVVSFFAKRARGAMAAWIVKNRIHSVGALRSFNGLGYAFDPERSTPDNPTFIRRQAA